MTTWHELSFFRLINLHAMSSKRNNQRKSKNQRKIWSNRREEIAMKHSNVVMRGKETSRRISWPPSWLVGWGWRSWCHCIRQCWKYWRSHSSGPLESPPAPQPHRKTAEWTFQGPSPQWPLQNCCKKKRNHMKISGHARTYTVSTIS